MIFSELQLVFWYIIYTLLKIGHQKSHKVHGFVVEKPEMIESFGKNYFKVYLVGKEPEKVLQI